MPAYLHKDLSMFNSLLLSMRGYSLVTVFISSELAKMEAVVLLLSQIRREKMLRAGIGQRRRVVCRHIFKRGKSVERFVFVCVLSRSGYWWQRVVKETFSTHDWSESFRMSRQTFMYICNELRVCIEKKDTTMRDSIRTEQRVAITLWYLSTGADFRTIGHLFGVAKSTVCIIIKSVCCAIVQLLLPKYIRRPIGDGGCRRV